MIVPVATVAVGSDTDEAMPDVHVFQPATLDEARALLAASPPAFDSPTQLRFRSDAHLDDTFTHGRRRREWVWGARSPDGAVGSVALLGTAAGKPLVVDHFGLTGDPAIDAALVRHASEAARSLGVDEAAIFAPPSATLTSPEVAPLAAAVAASGWEPLVERLHYEFAPHAELAVSLAADLHFEVVGDPADPRLADLIGDVIVGSLDAHHLVAIEREGVTGASARLLAELLEDPVEYLRLVVDRERSDEPVGLVSWNAFGATGRGFVFFVGVGAPHRGRGYAARMVAEATRELLAAGSTMLIADTDRGNVPMAAAFAAAGWPVTETLFVFRPA